MTVDSLFIMTAFTRDGVSREGELFLCQTKVFLSVRIARSRIRPKNDFAKKSRLINVWNRSKDENARLVKLIEMYAIARPLFFS